MEFLLIKNDDSTFKNGISTFQEWRFYFLRMDLTFQNGNSYTI